MSYTLQIMNATNLCQSTQCAPLCNFTLHVSDVIQKQFSETVGLMADMEQYVALFYAPLYFKIKEHDISDARSPPYSLPKYSEV